MSGVPTLNPFSPEAVSIYHLFVAILLVMLAIFTLVATLMTVAIVRYRDREGAADARQEFGNPRLEMIWTAVPALLLVVIFVFTVRTIHASDPPVAGRTPDLRVIGHQWWWETDYPASGVVTANEIHIPVGSPILIDLRIRRRDPRFLGAASWGAKSTRSPVIRITLWIERRQARHLPWHLRGVLRHRARVDADSASSRKRRADFDAWQHASTRGARGSPSAAAAVAGRADLSRQDLHQLPYRRRHGWAIRRVGPDLTHLAQPGNARGGGAPQIPRTIFYKWLKDPNSIKPDSHMPNFKLTDDEAHATGRLSGGA